jgi:peptidoglycan-associated lipoprotein
MVNFYRGIGIAVLSLVIFGSLTGCPKKQAETATQNIPAPDKETPAPPSTFGEPPPAAEPPPVTEKEITRTPEKADEGLKDIFFDYDKSTIRPDAKEALDADVRWLKANAQAKVKIEGHCDERGTNEYNLALGERRAHSIKQFFITQGVSPSRISTISYGEDRPFCTDSNESCFLLNRRAHFVMMR